MLQIPKTILFPSAKLGKKFLFNREYRTYLFLLKKLCEVPRYKELKVSVNGLDLTIADAASFLSAYEEIFVQKIYAFPFDGDSPSILDLGANIGLSVLFFKQLYPKAKITAFEADPNIFKYLEHNVHGNGYADVELLNLAAWNVNTTLQFHSEGADGGRVGALTHDVEQIPVNAVDMQEYLQGKKIDFLKMDIEGAEEQVLPACMEYLPEIRFIFIEYHSSEGKKQYLHQLTTLLTNAGFRLHIHSIQGSPSPFMEIRTNTGFDLQLNIFGWRE